LSAHELVLSLGRRGIRLWADGANLRYSAPKGALGPGDIEQLKQNKAEILDLLTASSVPAGAGKIERVSRDGALVMSFGQQRLWFLTGMEGVSEAYHVMAGFRLSGPLNEEALRRALLRLVARHEALRTRFVTLDGEAVQWIDGPETPVAYTVDDLGAKSATALEALMAAESATPFDLERGPLFRARRVRLAAQEHVLLLTMHHIVSDGWSLGVMRRELGALYTAFASGDEDRLTPLTVQYADYAAWQRRWLSGSALAEQAQYWRTALAGAPTLIELPTDRQRPSRQDFAGASVPVTLDRTTTAGLKRLAQRQGLTLYMVVLAGWALVLSKLSGQDDIVIGSPSANRGPLETEGLIGFFVNMLAMRIDLSDAPSVTELLSRVRRTTLAAQAHQDLPFEQVVEVVRPVRNMAHSPIFQVALAWQNTEPDPLVMPDLVVEPLAERRDSAKFDLLLDLTEQDGMVVGALEYASAVFDSDTAARFARYLETALRAIAGNPDQAAAAVPLLSGDDRQALLNNWTGRATRTASVHCLHQLFEQRAAERPAAVALIHLEAELRYGELNARANQLARHLRMIGVGPDARVGICMDRSFEMIIAMLAVLKAGGAYVPLDPEYPASRLAFMLADVDPVVVLYDQAGCEALAETISSLARKPTVIDIRADVSKWSEQADTDLPQKGIAAHGLAYVIYTSGSTGKPKGVMVEHRNVTRLLAATRRHYRFGADDIWTLFHSFSFDFSVWEIWGALAYGGSLIIVPKLVTRAPADFYRLLADKGVTVLNQTPSAFRTLIAAQRGTDARHSLRSVIFGGEALEPSSLSPWCEDARNRDTQLVNMYGITETTVHVSYQALSAPDISQRSATPIGLPLDHLRLYVLDERREPCPAGVVGEFYVGGEGLARGYLNRPGLTSERFVPDPFVAGERMYKTGDVGRLGVDGSFHYVGRNDSQVKIRGFRLELGEIEARLASHPGIAVAVVIPADDGAGSKRLIAYYVAATADQPLESTLLREHLAAALPEHMVPAAFVGLDALPLTSNGKLDRKALPAPDASAFASRVYEPPRTPLERTLAAIWADVLDIDRIGRRDNFFDLGGHSLLAVRMLALMRDENLHADIRDVFAAPDLAALTQRVSRRERESAAPEACIERTGRTITPDMLPLIKLEQTEIDHIIDSVPGGVANIQDIYPLAPLQDGLLFHHLLSANGDPFVFFKFFSFADRATLERYAAALNRVIDRNDILRTAIVWQGLGRPVQVVWRQATLVVEEVRFARSDRTIIEQMKQSFSPRAHRMNITHAPMMRLVVGRNEADDGWIGMLLIHHLIDDNRSMKLFDAEVAAFLANQGEALPAPLPFRNFIKQVALADEADHRAFFSTMLGDIDEPTAPFGMRELIDDGGCPRQARLRLEDSLNQRIRTRARVLGVSPASLFHVAWGLVVAAASGATDPVFGTVLLGRVSAGPDADRVMGLFINTLPIRLRLADTSIEQCVRATHGLLAELIQREHASLALVQQCSAVPTRMPLFTSLLNYRHDTAHDAGGHNGTDHGTALAGHGIVELEYDELTPYPLNLSIDDSHSGFELTVLSETGIDPHRVKAMMATALEGIVETLEEAPTRPVHQISVLPPAEREEALTGWNDTKPAYPAIAGGVHKLIEAQALHAADAVALVQESRQLTFAELDVQADALAVRLRCVGVQSERIVAICLERSPELVIAMLAVLKAGGAYLPLDPVYPGERIAFMLRDSGACALIVDSATRAIAAHADAQSRITVVDIGQEEPAAVAAAVTPQLAESAPGDLAYVIYTSGSTGTPKGVMVEHRNLHNLIAWHIDALQLRRGEACSSVAGLGFDAFAWEVWPSLAAGACLHLLPSWMSGDVAALLDWWRAQPIHVSFLPTPIAQLALSEVAPPATLRTLLVGGDRLRRQHAAPPYQVINAYGLTETTIVSTAGVVDVQVEPLPIGTPIANTHVYVLNQALKPVPLGVDGEIYIGGAGIARGYLNRPELTAERFIDSPFVAGDRLFRTGDIGHASGGTLIYVGRNDGQVKIRGTRVEPAEVEALLEHLPEVREAAVVPHSYGPGDLRLIAYVCGRGDRVLSAESLRSQVEHALPAAMHPAVYVMLDHLPLTPNGKVDRRALARPVLVEESEAAHQPELGSTAAILAELWTELLGTGVTSTKANFFDIGGHSLLAVRLILRIRQVLGVEVSLRDLMSRPTIEALSLFISDNNKTTTSHLIPLNHWCNRSHLVVFMPTILGSALRYRSLAQLIDQGCDIAAWQLPGFASDELPLTSIADMATACVDEVRRLGSYDRISFVGWSFGGILAFEAARQLGGRNALAITIDALTLPPEGKPSEVDRAAAFEELIANGEEDIPADQVEQMAAIYQAHYSALAAYRPSSASCKIAEIRASETELKLTTGSLHGSRLAAERASTRIMRGDHFSILARDREPELAGILAMMLADAAPVNVMPDGEPIGC
jgi:amino acid adenylation domain-containing protein